jgi:hypothetical protein
MARSFYALALFVAACNGKQATTSPTTTTETPNTEAPEAPAFEVKVTPPTACAAQSPCEAKVVLTALDKFKVNKEYPFKFVVDENPAITVDSKFTPSDDVKTGMLLITVRAEKPGTVKVSGTFKLSVCTDDVCKIEQPKIAFEVPVT